MNPISGIRRAIRRYRSRASRLHRQMEALLGADDVLLGVLFATPGTRPGLDWTLLGLLLHRGSRPPRRWVAIAILADRFEIWRLDFRNRPTSQVACGDRALVGALRRDVEWRVAVDDEVYWIAQPSVRVARQLLRS